MNIKKAVPQGLKSFYSKANWFIRNYDKIDEYAKLNAAFYYGPVTYHTDGLATCLNCDFISDLRFKKAYDAALGTNPWPGFTLQWRVYVVCYFADHVKQLQGDFVECGVNTGAYAKAIIEYTDFNNTGKIFHLLDTYDGLVPESLTEKEKEAGLSDYLGQYKNVYEGVLTTFKKDKVNIIRGRVPATLPLCTADRIAYLSIDMNVVEPEVEALEYFYDKVVTGGVIMLDDYGFPQHINQKLAHDAFALKKGVNILSLPTGQGVIIKK